MLLVNPLGGVDNWVSMSRWFRRYAGTNARRTQLAGLASEERPDEAANLKLLWDAAATHRRAIALPPDEAFSAERAAEVSLHLRRVRPTLCVLGNRGTGRALLPGDRGRRRGTAEISAAPSLFRWCVSLA